MVKWQVNNGAGFTNLSDGGVYGGVTTTTLTITGATADMNGYQYRAVFTNGTPPDATTTPATLTVNPALGISPATLPSGGTKTPYQQTITVTGGTAPFSTFSVSGFSGGGTGLTSSEITADAASGTIVIDGTPTAAGSASFMVNVTDSAGAKLTQSYTIVVNNVVVVQPPVVTAITPTSGGTAGGTTVTITGTGFTDATDVDFGDVAATDFVVNSDTSISAMSPEGTGTVDVTVTTANGTSATSSADQFTYATTQAPPVVVGISPTSGPPAGGTIVTIIGSGFSGTTEVDFDSVAAPFAVMSDTEMLAMAPAGTGTVDVTVTTANGTSATSSADQFSYVAANAPTVTALLPASGSAAGGTLVSIVGTNLANATAVTFGTTVVTTFVSDVTGHIDVYSPSGVAGVVDVTVTTANGISAVSAADQFTYVAAARVPTVTAVSPTSGPAAGGTAVTITGTGFTGATAVSFGGVAATAFTVVSDTKISATSPAGSAGAVDVRVNTAAGPSTVSSADQFTYAAAVSATAATVGLYDMASSTFMLRNTCDSGAADEVCAYGTADGGMVPIVGDWDGNGIDSIGLYDPTTSTFYLRNTNCLQGPNDKGYADTVFVFGPADAGYEPVAGNWDGKGGDGIGLYDPATATFYLRNTIGLQGSNDHGYADIVFTFGAPNSNMFPLAGDWDGGGSDGVGLYSQATSTFYLRETPRLQGAGDRGFADATLNYGAAGKGMYPVAGDWNGDGRDGIGLYDPATATFLLRNAIQLQGPSDKGYADLTFVYGKPGGSELPLAGNWIGTTINPGQPSAASGPAAGTTGTISSPAAWHLSTGPLVSQSEPATTTGQNVTGANLTTIVPLSGATSLAGDTSVLSGGTIQSELVNSRAVDQIDLSAVAATELGHFARSRDLDALTGDIVGGAPKDEQGP